MMKPKSIAAAFASWFVIISLLCSCISGDQNETNYEGLSYNYYEKTCPRLDEIVRSSISPMFALDPTAPAALLRLMFHDCQVQGCDASILIEPSGDQQFTELDSAKNFGIRKRELIGSIKTSLEVECPQQVSCSDLIILVAREAVALTGGPLIAVPLGRKDSLSTPSKHVADSELPPSTADVDSILNLFAGIDMTIEESVAIMGSHSIGVTHCNNVLSRFDNENATNANMDPRFQTFLRVVCPEFSPTSKTAEATFVPNDQTSLIFDTAYYDDSIAGRGNLRIDSEIGVDPRTRPFVEAFAADQDRFFGSFSSAFVKLSSYKVLTGNNGVVRGVCDKVD
ncbi:PREDICTED: peroxidase 29 [Brassica oleracea var. oleracea]|uniref:Peroxidase n=1 Tax=Brassica oleracea var. oleracea TaxID=109376 RepID=A0A0D3CJF4_BRAOL|nr:PREDICTED: peroxidase 29 [Brassica oleracea var. oleracea]